MRAVSNWRQPACRSRGAGDSTSSLSDRWTGRRQSGYRAALDVAGESGPAGTACYTGYWWHVRINGVGSVIDYRDYITIEPGKRGGKPCVRGLRITVYDVLSYLASGMSLDEVLADFPALTREDVLACLAYAAEREQQTLIVSP